jgi:hypothetical protein
VDVARALGADADTDGRGVAAADLDGDGRLDLVMSNNNAPPTLYLNALRGTGNWLRLSLAGPGGKGDAVGARVTVKVRAGGAVKALLRQVEAGGSYASQSEGVLHFGLGAAEQIEELSVLWPDGTTTSFAGPQLDGLVNRVARLAQGGAIEPGPAPFGRPVSARGAIP